MPVNIKAIPPQAKRSSPPSVGLWFIALVILLSSGGLISLVLAKNYDTPVPLAFILFICLLIWLVLAFIRTIYYLLNTLWADSFDRAREQTLWHYTQRGRRTLQILWSEFYTEDSASTAGVFITGSSPIKARPTWQGEQNVRHSRLPFLPGSTPESTFNPLITLIIDSLAKPLSLLADNVPIALHIEVNSTLLASQIEALVLENWSRAKIRQTPHVIYGNGLEDVDKWLDERAEQQALLLVLAVQIAPDSPAEKGESVTMLLLGNTLTQRTLQPFALLHRPQASSPDGLNEGIELAGYWAALDERAPERLWLAGLSSRQKEKANGALGEPLLKPAAQANHIVDLDTMTGYTGCVAPWLAIAAAAQMSCENRLPQIIISGHSNETLWSTVVSPA